MYTSNGIVQTVHKSGRKYLIHIQTGEMVEVIKRLDKTKVSFIRTMLSDDEVEQIRKELGITILRRQEELSSEETLKVLKKMAKTYKRNFDGNNFLKVTFNYNSKEIVV